VAPKRRNWRIITGDPEAVEAYMIFHNLRRFPTDVALEHFVKRDIPPGMAIIGTSKELAGISGRSPVGAQVVLVCTDKPGNELKGLGTIRELRRAKPSPALAQKWLEKYDLDPAYAPQLQYLDELNLNGAILSGIATGRFDLQSPLPTASAIRAALEQRQPLPVGWQGIDGLYFILAFTKLGKLANQVLSVIPDLPPELLAVMAVYSHRRYA
jgi:hypothetical protein